MSSTHRSRQSSRQRSVRSLLLVVVPIVAAGLFWFWFQMRQPFQVRQPNTDVRFQIAYDAIQQGNFDTARRELQALFEQDPDNVDVILWLTEVCILSGDESGAIGWLERIPDSSGQRAVEASFRAAQLAMKASRAQKTRQLLQRCLRLDSNHVAARRMLIRLDLILTRWEAMREQIVELDRRGQATATDVIIFCTGRNYFFDDESHIEWLEACLEQSPDDCVVRSALASYYTSLGRRSAARALLRSPNAPRTGFESWRITLGIIEDLIDDGRFQEAHDKLSRIPSEADSILRTWLARGRVLAELEEFELAIIAYRNASRLDLFDPEPVSAVSRLLARRKKHDEAAGWLRRTQLNEKLRWVLSNRKPLAASEPPPKTVLEIGQLLNELGRNREAMICFESLLTHRDFSSEASRFATATRQSPQYTPHLSVAHVEELDLSQHAAVTKRNPDSQQGSNTKRQTADAAVSEESIELKNIAADVGIDFKYFRGDTGKNFLPETLGGGIGAIDYDLDDWPDLYFTQGTSLPVSLQNSRYSNRLFRNVNGTSAVDVTVEAGLIHGGYGQGCAVADFDNDGFPDLFVCNNGENVLYHNNGDGTFSDVTRTAGLSGAQWSTSAAFADFDRDGDLDLYCVNFIYAPFSDLEPLQSGRKYEPGQPMDYPAELDTYWENTGNGTFRNRTDSVGVHVENGKGLGVLAVDFNQDGWTDLFVGNDTTGNFLFVNLGNGPEPSNTGDSNWNGFQEMGVLSGVAYNRNGVAEACMGITCADFDHDGLFDFYVTNFERETNTFYRNLGNLNFEDYTHRLGLADPSRSMLGWGAQFIDLNADGEMDLFVANGHLYDQPMVPQLFLKQSASRFHDISNRAGSFFKAEGFGRSVASVDWNRDLAADLAVGFLKSPVALLENTSRMGNRLAIRLIGVNSNRDAMGAFLTATVGESTYHFRVGGDGGFFASNEKDVIIGIGLHKQLDTLEVSWPTGQTQTWNRLPIGKTYIFIEGKDVPATALQPHNAEKE